MKLPAEPILLTPHFEKKIWGGNKLKSILGKQIPDNINIGESWEVSAIKNKESFIAEGPLRGENLRSLYEKFKEELLGKIHTKYLEFPLIIKFIDAKERLSIQVHPPKNNGKFPEKNECWFIIKTGEKGAIATGFNKKLSKEELIEAINSKRIEELLNIVTVKEGETYFIPAGSIHAILEDVLIYEIQQSSNITFRLYDWDRKFSQEERQLQIKEALEVAELDEKKSYLVSPRKIISNSSYSTSLIISNSYFIVKDYIFYQNTPINFVDNDTIKIFTAISGSFAVEWEGKLKEVRLGCTVIIPSILKNFNIVGSTNCRIIASTIPY